MLQFRGVLGLFRMHQKPIVDFRPHRKSHKKGQSGKPRSRLVKRRGKHDPLFRWIKGQRPKWREPAQWAGRPGSLLVRELRYTFKARGQRTRVVTIATTLLHPIRYPKEEIAA